MNPELLAILERHIPCGLYVGEREQDFPKFLDIIDGIMRSGTGPRCQVISDMKADPAVQSILSRYDIHWSDITRVFKQIMDKFRSICKAEAYIRNQEQKLSELYDPQVQRNLQQHLCQSSVTIEDIIQRKVDALSANRAELATHPDREEYTAVMRVIQPYIDRWQCADKEVGHNNTIKGLRLEDTSALEQLRRRGITVDKYWRNVYYSGAAGELDMLVRDTSGHYIILEYKSRVYDIAAAYLQNGPGRDLSKRLVVLDGTDVELPLDTQFFVVTTLPEHEFVLPIESDLKRVLTYRIKHPELTLEDIWTYARTHIGPDRLSPVEWYRRYHSIVLVS